MILLFRNKYFRVLFFLILLLLFLFYKRDICQENVNKMLMIVPLWIYCIYAKRKYVEYLLILLLPISFGLSTGYVFPFALLGIWLKNKTIPWKAIAFTFLIALLEFLHFPFYSFDYSPDLVVYVNYFSAICIMAYYLKINRDYDINKLLLSFCVGSSIFCVFVVWNTIASVDLATVLSGDIRVGLYGIKDTEESMSKIIFASDANTLGFFSVTSISVLLIMLYNDYKHKLLIFTLMAINFACGVLTLSRTWYICLIFSAIYFIICNKQHKAFNYMLISIVVVGCVLFFVKFDFLFTALIGRFSGDSTASGRTEIFAMYNEYIFSHIEYLLFGGGAIYYREAAGFEDATHNGVQQIIACYGIVGLVVFIAPLISAFKKTYVSTRKNAIYLLPLIIVLFYLQSLQSINPCSQMFPLLPAYWSLMYSKYNDLR